MTLRMGDGPAANLPGGLDAVAGYADDSGIGETWPAVLALPTRFHLSISTVAGVAAMCGDVESGALASWKGYPVGYAAIANVQGLIDRDGRPPKLWTAHHNDVPHICGPGCGFGFTGHADGTQWTDHGNTWDESLLSDTFFDFLDPSSPTPGDELATIYACQGQPTWLETDRGNVIELDQAALDRWVAKGASVERVGVYESQQWAKKAGSQ